MSILKSFFVDNNADISNDGVISLERYNCAEEVLEISEGYREIVAIEDALERLEEISESLESFIQITEDSLETGGLTAETAHVLRISTEALVAPLGLSSPILSVESFGGDSERLTSTRVSLEEERVTLQKIWDAIKRTVVSLREKISEWYENMFKNVDKVIEKSKKVKEVVTKISGDPEKDKISYNLSKLITSNQKEGDVVNNLSNLKEYLELFSGNTVVGSANTVLGKFKSLDVKTLDADKYKAFLKDIGGEVKKYAELASNNRVTNVPSSMAAPDNFTSVIKHKTLPGNKALYAYFNSNDPKRSTWKMGPDLDNGTVKDSKEFKTISKGDLLDILDVVDDMTKEMKAAKSEIDKANALKKDISGVGDKMVKDAKGSDGEKATGAAVGQLKTVENMLNNPINAIMGHAFRTSDAALSFVTAVTKAY